MTIAIHSCRFNTNRRKYKKPLEAKEEDLESEPTQLLSPKRKKLNFKSVTESNARLEEMQSPEEYEQMTIELQKEADRKRKQNDDHISSLLKVFTMNAKNHLKTT